MPRKAIWNIENIKEGIERYYKEYHRYPTAIDFDGTDYLPSARQIQRAYGGMEVLRQELGYEGLNYTKGSLRSAIAKDAGQRGVAAEDALELALIAHFGEPYVHTQKRYYKQLKNRWDFFVYYNGGYFGIDIFSTTRASYIMRNINHKLAKYANVPSTIPIYFVVDGVITDGEIKDSLSPRLLMQKNIVVISLSYFLSDIIPAMKPLQLPEGATLVLDYER